MDRINNLYRVSLLDCVSAESLARRVKITEYASGFTGDGVPGYKGVLNLNRVLGGGGGEALGK